MNSYVVLDIETTGTHPIYNEIIEIGGVYIEDNEVKEKFSELVCPKEEISEYITNITGITNEMVQDMPSIEKIMPRFIKFCKEVPLVGHNLNVFDYRMLKAKAVPLGFEFEKKSIDTLIVARKMLGDLPSRKLGDLCDYYGISLENAHRAYDDAFATYELYKKLEADFRGIEPKLFVPEAIAWELPKSEPVTKKQKAYLEALCKKHQVKMTKPMEMLTKSECSRLIDRIISKYGRG